MNERRCRACGAGEQPGANFCPQCGVASDAEFVDLAEAEAEATETLDVSRSTLAKLLVPLGVFALVGMLILALLGAGGSNEPDPTAEAERPSVAPVATIAPAPTVEPTSTPAATPPPTPTPLAVNAPVDPTVLPPTDATHLAIAYRSTVDFLDLRSGTWTRSDVGRRIGLEYRGAALDGGGVSAFGAGVLVQTESGEAISVSINGDATSLVEGVSSGLLAVRDNVAFVHDYGDENRSLAAVSPAGEILYQIPLTGQMWPAGVTTDGLVAVQAGASVVLVGVKGSISLGTGILNGVVGNKVLLYDCISLTECGTEIVDAITGERNATTVKGDYFQAISNDEVTSYGPTGEVVVYRLVGNELIEVPDARQATNHPGPGLGFGTDSSGVSVRMVIGQIDFVDDAGAVLASVPFEVDQCCRGGFGVAFIYAE